MPIALTVFGVAERNKPPSLAYVYVRSVRGMGDYPPPVLPNNARNNGIRRAPVADFDDLELVTWDKVVDEDTAAKVRTEFGNEPFIVPVECGIAPGSVLEGHSFGPVIVSEANNRTEVSGAGTLYVRGLAVEGRLNELIKAIDKAVGRAKSPSAIDRIINQISDQCGFNPLFKQRRRLGVVDFFYRAESIEKADGPLFNVIAVKPDLRSREPMRQVRIVRVAAPLDKPFRLHITLKNFDDVLRDFLIDLRADQAETTVEAEMHITDVEFSVFDEDGSVADRFSGSFLQTFNFGVTAIGRSDDLPPPFRGARDTADLEKRARVSTTAFQGPSAGDRSAGLDRLRRIGTRVASLVGDPQWKPENQWIEFGGEGQVEVIRWIKKQLERPGITKAYLVDPYIGSEALQRVIARQGNENIALWVLVSPGGTDPDAEDIDAGAKGDHLAKLKAAASDWSDRLCGQISIIHIQRGDGRKQAFHDRYLSIVEQNGVPTVYLLSNSLSKAAGDWPFAICEMDRIRSWQVHSYILDLIDGKYASRALHPSILWQREGRAGSDALEKKEPASSAGQQPEWAGWANDFLKQLFDATIRNSREDNFVGDVVNRFMNSWPQGVDAPVLADHIFRAIGHRGEAVVWTSSRLVSGTAAQHAVADRLGDLLLDKFLEGLPRGPQKATSYPPFNDRDQYLRSVGRAIAGKASPTNFVRDQLNPIVNDLVEIIETQRFGSEIAGDSLLIGICLISVGLVVSIAADNSKADFRIGLATDYIHWMARLMRSETASGLFQGRDQIPDIVESDLRLAFRQMKIAREVLGEKLVLPIERLLRDPWITPRIKEMAR